MIKTVIPSLTIFFLIAYDTRPMNAQEIADSWAGAITFFGLIIIFAGIYFIRKSILKKKGEKLQKFIREFQKNDPFWDENKMLEISSQIFYNVQKSWVRRNSYHVADYITPKLKQEWETAWEKMALANIGFQCGKIDIKSITIVGAEDNSNNNNDKFSVEISAYLKRYMYHRATMKVISTYTSQLEHITDIYSFIRENDKWKLNNINYNASLMEVISNDVIIEKPGKPGKL